MAEVLKLWRWFLLQWWTPPLCFTVAIFLMTLPFYLP